MENKEFEKVEEKFNFTKKLEKEIDNKFFNANLKKKAQFVAFITLGCVTIGFSMGIAQSLGSGYLVNAKKNANIEELQAKSEEVRKNKQFEIDSKRLEIQKDEQDKENKKKQNEVEKLNIQQEKATFNLLLKNKVDMISNYESQLNIYDIPYKESVAAVKNGLLGLDELNEIRALYQSYRDDIHKYIRFVNEATSSFEFYHNLTDENKNYLNEELIKYQSGGLNRNNDLENALLAKISGEHNDSAEREKARRIARDKMIDDLADVMKNDNSTTTVKKLKR